MNELISRLAETGDSPAYLLGLAAAAVTLIAFTVAATRLIMRDRDGNDGKDSGKAEPGQQKKGTAYQDLFKSCELNETVGYDIIRVVRVPSARKPARKEPDNATAENGTEKKTEAPAVTLKTTGDAFSKMQQENRELEKEYNESRRQALEETGKANDAKLERAARERQRLEEEAARRQEERERSEAEDRGTDEAEEDEMAVRYDEELADPDELETGFDIPIPDCESMGELGPTYTIPEEDSWNEQRDLHQDDDGPDGEEEERMWSHADGDSRLAGAMMKDAGVTPEHTGTTDEEAAESLNVSQELLDISNNRPKGISEKAMKAIDEIREIL